MRRRGDIFRPWEYTPHEPVSARSLLPWPGGVDAEAWLVVVCFLTSIGGIILKGMPIGVMAMMAIVIVALSQVTSTSSKGAMADALGSFSSPLIWLIVVAILIARGLKKTGLGNRIGLLFIARLGKKTIGIGYGHILNIEDQDLFGDEVNLSCKLSEDIASRNAILFTERAYAQLPEPRSNLARQEVSVSGLTLVYYELSR